jgi:hypothetical protein
MYLVQDQSKALLSVLPCLSLSISLCLSLLSSLSPIPHTYLQSASLIVTCSYFRVIPGLYGTAQWADGASGETDSQPEPISIEAKEGWTLFSKAFFFLVIIAGIILYLRLSKKENRENLGYEKTQA